MKKIVTEKCSEIHIEEVDKSDVIKVVFDGKIDGVMFYNANKKAWHYYSDDWEFEEKNLSILLKRQEFEFSEFYVLE